MQAVEDKGYYVVAGPPGCGKTTYLSRQVQRIAGHVGGENIRLVSLTKTAAQAIRSKVGSVPDQNVGTVHSLAYHMAGRPELATSKEHVKLWNERYPDLAIEPTDQIDRDDEAPGRAKGDDPLVEIVGSSAAPGQKTYDHVCLLRNLRIPVDKWQHHRDGKDATRFWSLWQEHMDRYDLLDFTGFVERAVEDFNPGTCDYLFVDECQDLSTLEQEFVSLFKPHVKRMIQVGDPDQALYDWRGADWSLFTEIDDEFRHVLSQSYRVPELPHALARDIILRCSHRRDAPYSPTGEAGEVETVHDCYKQSSALLSRLLEDTVDGESAMFIAPCGYMVDQLIGTMRAAGVPFHNPYRPRNGRWNPLGPRKGTPLKDRLLAFVEGDWREPAIMRMWLEPLTGVLRRGMKKAISHEAWLPPNDLRDLFTEEGHASYAANRSLTWWIHHLPQDRQQSASYPLRVYENLGRSGLTETPRIIVGTIHSTKGGESDHVYVAPDLSPRGLEQIETNPDALHRLFYVATTRCRKSLRLLWPAGKGSSVTYWT